MGVIAGDVDFTEEQRNVWTILYKQVKDLALKHGSNDYVEGFKKLDLPSDKVPTIEFLHSKIHEATGWNVVRTTTRYSDAMEWYHEFAKKNFIVTNYLRSREELNFTPEPDMFHDIFGHLPFMMVPDYVAMVEMFAPAFLKGNEEQRENVKRLAWYTYEFGITEEGNEKKICGPGILSSKGEIEKVVAYKTPLLPFSVEAVIKFDKSIYDFNSQLFVIHSIADLKRQLKEYFDTF